MTGVRCDHTSVLRWLAGEQPRPPVPELAALVLRDALGRKVSETELGMTPSNLPGDLGLQLSTGWPDTIATSTALWRADVQRRRFLANAVFTSAALPASALRWLTSPPADAPAASGTRRVRRRVPSRFAPGHWCGGSAARVAACGGHRAGARGTSRSPCMG